MLRVQQKYSQNQAYEGKKKKLKNYLNNSETKSPDNLNCVMNR